MKQNVNKKYGNFKIIRFLNLPLLGGIWEVENLENSGT
jgi:hypothetical protein